ncbi:hypothetical protein BA78_7746 [Aspergillus niger]|uniref:Reverse transcriptase/retrotransposon-derived protein RNase H-like domain-containing protein n=1 Tax=Aspergillus niger TaxID=5061 RepID=A0A100IGM6_ASPNG|nr:hypothetical protein BA78_7746 [Aspergillus niger]
MIFLHFHYFPRLAWAKLTLNPKKTHFFTSSIGILGHERAKGGLRPSADKITAIRNWPTPTDEEQLSRFLYALPFLRIYIPGRADLTKILRAAVQCEGKGQAKKKTGYVWGPQQKEAFQRVKYWITRTGLAGGDPAKQYHLATDASNTGAMKSDSFVCHITPGENIHVFLLYYTPIPLIIKLLVIWMTVSES